MTNIRVARMDAKITQLVIQPQAGSKNSVRTFTTKPSKEAARASGKIFGLIEIRSTDNDNEALIDFLINEIKINYYEATGADLRRSLSERFESALKKTNIAFTTYLEREHVTVNLDRTNILIGVSHGRDIHLTILGSIWAVLFYHIARDTYRIINIVDSTQSSIISPDPLKLFSQVISGRVRPRDTMLVTTENVFDFFSLERIKSIITQGTTAQGLAELRSLLTKTMKKESFGLIAVEPDDAPEPIAVEPETEKFNYQQAATRDSINQLIATERQTERLLTPSLKPELKKYLSSLSVAIQNYTTTIRSTTSSLYQRQTKAIRPKLTLPNIKTTKKLHQLKNRATNIWANATRMTRGLMLQISGTLRQQQWLMKFYTWAQITIRALVNRYRRLPKSSQRLLVITIALMILLINSTIWLGLTQYRTTKLEEFNRAVVEATTKRDEAESSLIYRDENLARQLLIDTKNILMSAQPASKDQRDQVALLERDITAQLNNLQHIVDITEPIQLANFQNVANQAQTTAFLALSRGFLFTQDSGSKAIYRANVKSRTISSIISQVAGTYTLMIPSADSELLLYGNDTPPMRLIVGRDELEPITITLPNNTKIDDAAIFNGKLYILDRAQNQIYRLNRHGNNYVGATNWLKADNTSLTNTVSLVVDGSIYLLKQNGELTRMENGQPIDFKTGAVDPAMTAPTKMRSPDGSPYLYMIDPPSKRIIVFNKQGGLVQQYTSARFTNLKDVAIDERDKKIYVLSDSTVYAIPAKHLE